MRLTELAPRWCTSSKLWSTGQGHVTTGLTFLCPHCKTERLGVEFRPWRGQVTGDGVPVESGKTVWKRTGDTFDTLTLTPSLDASSSGHWHGFITNGEVT